VTVRDRDHGVGALVSKLEAMRSTRLTVGVHADVGAELHPGSSATIAEVAAIQELGDEHQAPRAFVRGAVDARDLGPALRGAAERALAGGAIEVELGRVGAELADEMKRRAPVETGAVRDAIEARVNHQTGAR
jgi:hypothetical protein